MNPGARQGSGTSVADVSRVRLPLASMLAVAGGPACRGAQSALDPRGPQASHLFDVWVVTAVIGSVVLLVVVSLVVLALALPASTTVAPGGGAERSEAARTRQAAPAIAVGAGITVLVLIALVVYNVVISRAISASPAGALRIEVVARQWWWDVTYPASPPSRAVRTANELHIPVGQPVEIVLTSRDVIHSFWVPNLHGKMDAIPGRTNRLWLQADQPGVYRGQCAEFCGLQHAKMAFHVIAEAPETFSRWLVAQNAPAEERRDRAPSQGREVFLSSSCPMCHAVRGTEALATVGPDLTHIASRRALAAGVLPNNRGALGGWIVDPTHVKPGVFMPPNELGAEELRALLAYLETLR